MTYPIGLEEARADAALARWGAARAEIRRLRGRQGHTPTLAESQAAWDRLTELEVEEFSALAALKELVDVAALDAAHVAARQGPAQVGEG